MDKDAWTRYRYVVREAETGVMAEEWRVIAGYERYAVSNMGNVKNVKTGRILKFGHLKGYRAVTLRGGVRVQNYTTVHRLVATAFIGPSAGLQTRHLDGNKLNNTVENLAWGTAKENSLDRDRHGTTKRGEANPRAKHSEEKIRTIRGLADSGLGCAAIGRLVGMNKSRVHEIIIRKTWKHVDG